MHLVQLRCLQTTAVRSLPPWKGRKQDSQGWRGQLDETALAGSGGARPGAPEAVAAGAVPRVGRGGPRRGARPLRAAAAVADAARAARAPAHAAARAEQRGRHAAPRRQRQGGHTPDRARALAALHVKAVGGTAGAAAAVRAALCAPVRGRAARRGRAPGRPPGVCRLAADARRLSLAAAGVAASGLARGAEAAGLCARRRPLPVVLIARGARVGIRGRVGRLGAAIPGARVPLASLRGRRRAARGRALGQQRGARLRSALAPGVAARRRGLALAALGRVLGSCAASMRPRT